jgi:hypothetical protein
MNDAEALEDEPLEDEPHEPRQPKRPEIVPNTFMRQRDNHTLTLVGLVIALAVALLTGNC